MLEVVFMADKGRAFGKQVTKSWIHTLKTIGYLIHAEQTRKKHTKVVPTSNEEKDKTK